MNLYFGLIVLIYLRNDACAHRITGSKDAFEAQQSGVPGGLVSVGLSEPNVIKAAKFAAAKISEQSDSPKVLGLFKIVFAQRQVVAGYSYKIRMQVAKTNCSKSSPFLQDVCTVDPKAVTLLDPYYQECRVQVWEQPWELHRYELTTMKCVSNDPLHIGELYSY
ncbi:hypothetical protein WDU94_015466 [Cyamophila willieti]